jgi:hypothetical protein
VNFVIIEDTINDLFFRVEGLTPGVTYKFKVQARNSFGLSVYSADLELTVGYKPAQPAAPSTTVVADDVIVSWVAPDAHGSPITSFRITLQ